MGNEEISKLLKNVAAAYAIKDDKKYYFQIVAYQKASESIKSTPLQLKDLYKENKLEEVPGIGATIKSRLEELFKRGSVVHYNEILKGIPEAVFTLINIPSIGPKTAYKLTEKLGLKDPKTAIEDLLNKAENHEISKIPTFGEKSEEEIVRAIKEYKEGKGKTTRMILPFASEIADRMVDYLKKSPVIKTAMSLGSLRRMMPTVGDIDIAVATDNPEEAINYFIDFPYKERVIEKGPATASILTSGGKQIDLMAQPTSGFGALLQHFTGSKDHNVRLREYALKKGLSLSEYGIKNTKEENSKLEEYDTEEGFYHALGMDWIPPEMRENTGEIEMAVKHTLPELVELSNIKGDLHLHSSFPIEPSHDLGRTSIKDMVEYAKKLNYQYIGFAEHNPSVSNHANGQIQALIEKRNELIEQINESTKDIRVLKLLEVDILGSGKMAIDNKSLNLLDAAIVSIHSSFGTNKQEMTKRVLEGLSHPKAKILAHPTGRLLNIRPGYELDFDLVFDFCKKNNKVLEINSWPNRLDLPDSLIKDAIKNEVKMIINTDSHEGWQMDMMKYGVAMAKRGWASKNDIINTLNLSDFLKWIKI